MIYTNKEKIEETLSTLTTSTEDHVIHRLDNILERLPKELTSLIEEAFTYKRIPKEYLLSSILFTYSTVIGKTFYVEALGYKNYANLYFSIVGSRGDAKSEAIKIATDPIKKSDDSHYEEYQQEVKQATNFDSNEDIERKQVLIQNASIEAAHKIHFENPNGIGICIDEIYGLIEKMGNPNSRDGVAWRNFFLEGYTNAVVDVSRKSTKSFRITESCPTLLGGLQHQFLKDLFANGNLESGFVDRLLFTHKFTSNRTLKRGMIPQETVDNYHQMIQNLLAYKKQSERPEERIKQIQVHFTDSAKEKLFEYLQGLIDKQETAPSILKEYMAKMQISIHKFCVLSFIITHAKECAFRSMLNEHDVELAIALNEFYYANFELILDKNYKVNKEPITDQIIALAKKNKASQKAVAEITGLHKGTISKKWKHH